MDTQEGRDKDYVPNWIFWKPDYFQRLATGLDALEYQTERDAKEFKAKEFERKVKELGKELEDRSKANKKNEQRHRSPGKGRTSVG